MLLKCPDCGKEVSDKAKACLHCGRPIHSTYVLAGIKQRVRRVFAILKKVLCFLIPLVVASAGVYFSVGILELYKVLKPEFIRYALSLFICIYYPFLFLSSVKRLYGVRVYSILGWGGFIPCVLVVGIVLFGSFLEATTVAAGISVAVLCGLIFWGYWTQLKVWSINRIASRIVAILLWVWMIIYVVMAVRVFQQNQRDYERIMRGEFTIDEVVESAGSCHCSKCKYIREYNYKKIKEKYFPLDLRYFLEPKAIETPQAKGVK